MNPRLALVDTAMSGVRMLDLFSGIGGFHKGFAQAVAERICPLINKIMSN